MSLSLLSGMPFSGTARSSQGRAVVGAAKRTLEGEDRSEMIRQEGKASNSSAKGGPAKMAPSPAALNTRVAPERMPKADATGLAGK